MIRGSFEDQPSCKEVSVTHKYNVKEKQKRRKAKKARQQERVRELIAKAAKNKPEKPVVEQEGSSSQEAES